MLRFSCLFVLLVSTLTPSLQAASPPDRWIVVTAPAFRQALEPLCKHRRAQGYQVTLLETTALLSPEAIQAGDGEKLRAEVARLCGEGEGKKYVLLVGAFAPDEVTIPRKQACPPLRGTAGRMKGQLTDHGYSAPDKDLVPSVAVGRFPARAEDEVAQMVHKTIAFENDTEPGVWRQRLLILAGVPAFNPFVDKLVENLALTRLDRLDPFWCGRAIYYNPGSSYYVRDQELHAVARRTVEAEEGQFLTLYLGHSDANAFYAGRARFLDRRDWETMRLSHRGVFATFGCLGCQLHGRDGEGYGVAAMRNPNGPIGVIGSHGICFAAMVQLGADGLLHSIASHPPEHLGDIWLAVEKAVAKDKIDATTFALLDAVDGDRTIPQATQRREHLEMFLLLGDPATRLPSVPRDVRLSADETASPNMLLTVKGLLPEHLGHAQIQLTVERPVSSYCPDLEPLPTRHLREGDKTAIELRNWERANSFVLATRKIEAEKGRFEAGLRLPQALPYPRVIVRAYAVQGNRECLGILVVPVKK